MSLERLRRVGAREGLGGIEGNPGQAGTSQVREGKSTDTGWEEGAEKIEMRQVRRAGWAGSWVAVGQRGGCGC